MIMWRQNSFHNPYQTVQKSCTIWQEKVQLQYANTNYSVLNIDSLELNYKTDLLRIFKLLHVLLCVQNLCKPSSIGRAQGFCDFL